MAVHSRQAARNPRKVAEAALERAVLHVNNLKESLERPRVKVSEASVSLINYCKATHDPMVPSVWGPIDKRENPYAAQQTGCCNFM